MKNVTEIYESLSQEQKQQFEKLSELLRSENERCNLTRIIEPDQIMIKHFLDSLAAVELMTNYIDDKKITPFLIDIGSGGGFPAIPLAIALPSWNITSVEATGKKVDFQLLAVEELGLTNIEVLQERAEDLGIDPEYRQRFDFAITRAVGRLEIIAELTVPFLRKGGKFLTWKGPRVTEEMPAGKRAMTTLGMGEIKETPYTLPGDEQTDYRLVEATKIKNTISKYPREFKDIKKAPLGS